MSSLLVIGGSGFFGKSILDAHKRGLLKTWQIEQIYILSRSASTLKIDHPELVSESIQLVDADISLCGDLPYADYVIHAAASTDASKYLLASEKERDNILAATQNYCKLAKKYHQRSKIVYVSSGAVYGPQPRDLHEISEEFALEASLDGMPVNKVGYAAAKRESEKMIIELGQCGMKVSVARCFAFIGKYLPLDQHFAIGNFLRDGFAGGQIIVNAKNKVYRSYMYADDLVEWLLAIGRLATEDCPIFNVGSSQSIRIDELAEKISQKFGVSVEGFSCQSSEVDRYVPSVRRAMEWGMTQKYNIDQAIDKTITLLLADERRNT